MICLDHLSPEHLFVLLTKIRNVFDAGDLGGRSIPDDGLVQFMEHCSIKLGDAFFRTPRQTVTAFVNLLALLEQNPEADWQSLIDGADGALNGEPVTVTTEAEPIGSRPSVIGQDDELSNFRL